MKIVRFASGARTHYGILENGIIEHFHDKASGTYSGPRYEVANVRLLAPCQPTKIVAIGINYHSHAKEFKHELPENPLLFLKPATAVIGPAENIIYPAMSQQVDYEGELGVVIKSEAKGISAKEALQYVLGYTCFNDVTARDLQRRDGQWTRAKGFDTFAAVGPWIETELDAGALKLETRLNGELKQQGNTADLIFAVARIVSFVSQVMTLLPGDIIATGTPSGVGPMQPGDKIEISIEGIGTLINYVAAPPHEGL